MLSFYSESVLPGASYAGMAFDGFSFFLPLRGRAQVTVLSQTLTPIEKLKTRREYSKICYDRKRGCFWALSPRRRNALFQLTPDFEEVREFTVCAPECFKTPLTGLALWEESGGLLLSCGRSVLLFDPEKGKAKALFGPTDYSLILNVASMGQNVLFRAARGEKTFFVLAARDGEILAEEEAPHNLALSAMAPDPRTGGLMLLESPRARLIFAHVQPEEAKKAQSPAQSKKPPERAACKCRCECGKKPECECRCDGKHKCECECKCDCDCKRRCSCRCECKKGCKCECKCNCRCECECECNCECRCPCDEDRRRACNDIIESIALTEASIAHILNAEGEKLQRALELSGDPEKLLEFNKSVQRTVAAVTQLEHVLVLKLKTLQELCSCPKEKDDEDWKNS